MAPRKTLHKGHASVFDRKKKTSKGNASRREEANISPPPIVTPRKGHASVFDRKKKTSKGNASRREEANISPPPIVDDPPTSAAGPAIATPSVATPSVSAPAINTPAANAMFDQPENMTIYGGNFMQINAAKSDRHGFKLLQKQVSSSAFHNSAQRVDPPRCHPDTRVDIMNDIYDWIINSGHRDAWILWLNGAAGAGKSAILQSIAERCVKFAAIAIASFFFVRSDSTRNSMAPLIATLAYQLIQAIPETLDDILLIVERNPLIFEQSLDFQVQELLIQPLLCLPTHLQRLFVVFIDGLDECNDRTQQSNLIKLLGNVSSGRNVPVIFLIGSRREPQIEAEFSKKWVADILITYPLDDIQASDDIRRFLNAKFEEIKSTHLRRRYLPPDWPGPEAVEQIVAKSSGQFIYASVVINYISPPHTHPALQLDIINGIRPRNPSSENPFAYLDAVYRHIFSQIREFDIIPSVVMGNEISSYESLFQLAAGELEVHLADLSAVMRFDITIAPKPVSKIHFLHASLPDFLLDKSRSEDFYIDLDEDVPGLLCIFLERTPSMLDPLSTYNLEVKSDFDRKEGIRLFAIYALLQIAKPSSRLQRACMNFNYSVFDSRMGPEMVFSGAAILSLLKDLQLKDQGKAYHHVLDVFAAAFSQYWPSVEDSNMRLIRQMSPDLVKKFDKGDGSFDSSRQ